MSKIGLDLERIVFIGRTFEEYLDMFSITLEDLQGKKILDCPSGACSFTAIANQKGIDVTACDIAYYHKIDDLYHKGLKDLEHAMYHMENAKNNYLWNYFKNVEHLKKHRQSALNNCVEDMEKNSNRYIPVTLPILPFQNNEFDLILSAHFLFMYADRLDFDFHLKTLKELLRVCRQEVRIFPMVDLKGKRYEHLDRLVSELVGNGYRVEEKRVSYEFQAHANSMLIIRKE